MTELTDAELISQWKKIDWDAVEERLRKYQCEMSIAAYIYDNFKVRALQKKIVEDLGIRCLAVKQVAMSKAGAGVDHVRWTKPLEMMKAAIDLKSEDYHAQPMRVIKFWLTAVPTMTSSLTPAMKSLFWVMPVKIL